MKAFLACFIFVISTVNVYTSQFNMTIWQEGFDNLILNKRLRSYVIRRVLDTSLQECIKECLRTSRCLSINYAKKFPLCELNYETEDAHAEQFKKEVGFIFGNMKHFYEETADPSCRAASCPINTSCQQKDPSTVTCEISALSNSDCGIPEVVGGATMTGSDQGIGIGNHRLYKCGSLEAISVCKNDGEWTYVNITCSLADICGSVGNGYTYYSAMDICVKPYDTRKTYDEARSICIADGGDLIIVDTVEKHNFIGNNFCNVTTFWLGLTDREEEGVFKWVDNTTTLVQPSWSKYDNEAHTGNEADCVRFGCSSQVWKDADCYSTKAILCEMRIAL